jgi:signal transduction histidine kinase
MFRCALLFLSFSVLPISFLFAQSYSKTFFTVRNGLPESVVSSVAEDKINGYLWIATEGGGLARFDGRIFVSYSIEEGLSSNTIYKIFTDSRGNVWASTRLGLSKFDGEKFRNFRKLKNVYHRFVEFNDTIFAFDGSHSLIRIVNDSVYQGFTQNYAGFEVRDIFSNSPKWIYFYCIGNILIRKGLHSTEQIDLSPLGTVHSLLPCGDQINIVTSEGAYVWSSWGLQLIDRNLNFPILLADKEFKTIWIAGRNNITKMVREKNNLTIQDTLAINVRILDCMTDSEGTTWFGTEGKGLLKYSGNIFELIRKGVVTSISASGNELWVATREHGLEVSKNGRTVNHFDLGRHARVSKIKRAKNGNVWVSGDFGIFEIDSIKNQRMVFDADEIGVVNDIELDADNKLWIGGRTGLAYCSADTSNDFYSFEDLSSKWILAIKYIPYGNRIIVGTTMGVNQVFNGKTSVIVTSFDSVACSSIAWYKEKYLIIGSAGKGICIYNLDNGSTKYYSKKNGLASNVIHFLNIDKEGLLWIGSDRGLERIGFDEHFELQEYLHFNEDHGLTGLESNVSFFDSEDEYFGIVDGLYKFSEPDLEGLPEHQLHLTDVELIDSIDSKISVSKYAGRITGFFHVPENPILPYDQNSIQFSFAKVFKKYPRATSYKYILEGHDKLWSHPSGSRDITYQNLEPGNYTLRILARDVNGKWGSSPLEYSFSITPPFYKTSLFFMIVFLFAIGFIGFASNFYAKSRVERLLKQEKIKQDILVNVRKEIGIDFHDELGNQLARIINFISLIKINQNNANHFLTQIEDTTKNLISGTKDFIWALDRLNDSSGSLFVHIKDFGDRLLPEKNIEFRAFYEFPDDISLTIGIGRQINFIFKEAITNAFKYSNSTQVTLRFAKSNSQLEMILTDNGIGVPDERLNSNIGGIANMRLRSKRIRSIFNIDSGIQGTKISLLINI